MRPSPLHILPALLITIPYFLNAQQAVRNEDGTVTKELNFASDVCGKFWKWDEGHQSRRKYAGTVFTLEYNSDGTFCYNQRAEKNYWKLDGKFLEHSVQEFGKEKINPYGIFEGKYEILSVSESELVLKRVKDAGKPDKKKQFAYNSRQDSIFRFLPEKKIEQKPIVRSARGTFLPPKENNFPLLPPPDGMNRNQLKPADQTEVKNTLTTLSAETIKEDSTVITRTVYTSNGRITTLEKKVSAGNTSYFVNGEPSTGEYYTMIMRIVVRETN